MKTLRVRRLPLKDVFLHASIVFLVGTTVGINAEPVSLECRYVNEDRSPDWIALIQFDSEAGDATLTGYPVSYADQPNFHRVIERLPVDRTLGKIVVRRADSEKSYYIDRRTLQSQTERTRISETGTIETLTQFGKCSVLGNDLADRVF